MNLKEINLVTVIRGNGLEFSRLLCKIFFEIMLYFLIVSPSHGVTGSRDGIKPLIVPLGYCDVFLKKKWVRLDIKVFLKVW